jgi:hypothetical protein
VTSHHLCPILSVKASHGSSPHSGKGLPKDLNTKRQGLLRPSWKSACHSVSVTQKEPQLCHRWGLLSFLLFAQFSLTLFHTFLSMGNSGESALGKVSSKWACCYCLMSFLPALPAPFFTVRMHHMCRDRLVTTLLNIFTHL